MFLGSHLFCGGVLLTGKLKVAESKICIIIQHSGTCRAAERFVTEPVKNRLHR